jgi:8-oxo-dGTP pyrophosphatase MutT (NUDIX family)
MHDNAAGVRRRSTIIARMLDLEEHREIAAPKPAATVVIVRDAHAGLEVCVMQRSLQSSFLGGAVVFPGGRIEATDHPDHVAPDTLDIGETPLSPDDLQARIAVCRETLEEVGLALIADDRDELVCTALHASTLNNTLLATMQTHQARWAVSKVTPWSRWVTPEAERRRYDTLFFVTAAPQGQTLRADDREAIRVFWATPRDLLDAYDREEIALFPPTHRTLEELLPFANVAEVMLAARLRPFAREPICPVFAVAEGTPLLALPGDPLHPIQERRSPGGSRYVLSGTKWLPREA